MGFVAASLVFVLVSMVVIGCTDADQQKPSSFISIYDSYKNICHKIGWEPKCGKQPISGTCTPFTCFFFFFKQDIFKIQKYIFLLNFRK